MYFMPLLSISQLGATFHDFRPTIPIFRATFLSWALCCIPKHVAFPSMIFSEKRLNTINTMVSSKWTTERVRVERTSRALEGIAFDRTSDRGVLPCRARHQSHPFVHCFFPCSDPALRALAIAWRSDQLIHERFGVRL